MIKRNIQISWNAISGAYKYKVYRKKIQPAASAYNFVADVLSPLVSYTFFGSDEDERDAYQVKATDASDVLSNDPNAVQDIFFPDRASGIYTTNNSTPDGQPMTVPVDVAYMTKEEFIRQPIAKGLGITANHPDYLDGSLDEYLLQASSHVNRYCRRHFQKQTIDETYPNVTIQVSNPRLCVIPLKEKPFTQINSVTIQVLKFFIPFSLEYLIPCFQEQGYYQIVPMLSTAGQGSPLGTGTPIPSVILESSQLGIVWTNYTCGYDVIPQDIKYATALIVGKMIGLGKYNPLGLASFKTQTTLQTFAKGRSSNPIDDEASKILDKYKLSSMIFT
jgi:hypothetical protein